MLATAECEADPRGSRAYGEYYAKGTAPSKTCTTHVKLKICKETGKLANEFCKDTEEKVFITRPNSTEDLSWQKAADAQYMAPTETCDKHNATPDTEKPVITVDGKDTIEINVNSTFTMPKVTAQDNIDGDISDKIKTEIKKDGKTEDKIDTSKVGTYTITYTVEDSSKNVTTKTITVKVINNADKPDDKPDDTNTITNTVD